MRKVDYEELLLSDLRAALKENPLAYIPLGLLEWHGEHLPLGCDLIRAREMCRYVAHRLGGVVLPPSFFSCPGYSSFEGTITFDEDVVAPPMIALLREVEKVGFERAVIVSAHGGPAQESLLERVAGAYDGSLEVIPVFPGRLVEMGDHAGKNETASLMAVKPDLVALERFDPEDNGVQQYDIDEDRMWPAERRGWGWSEDLRDLDLAGRGEVYLERLLVRMGELLGDDGG